MVAKELCWLNKHDLEVLRGGFGINNIVISLTCAVYGFLGDITQDGFNSICKLKSWMVMILVSTIVDLSGLYYSKEIAFYFVIAGEYLGFDLQ